MTGINRRQFSRGALAKAGRALPAAATPVKIRAGWVVAPASSAPPLQSNLQLQKGVGLLRQDIDVKKYADLSMVAETAKRPD